MNLYFVRHGQTDWNKEGKMQGSSDIALNETGLEQASQLAQDLVVRSIKFDQILCSPLSRAKKTAEIINEKMNADFQICEELTEFYFGDWEGLRSADLKINQAEEFNKWLENGFGYSPKNGDSLFEVQQRLKVFVNKYYLLANQKNIAVVAHQGTLVALKSLITGKSDPETLVSYKQSNTEFDIMSLPSFDLERIK